MSVPIDLCNFIDVPYFIYPFPNEWTFIFLQYFILHTTSQCASTFVRFRYFVGEISKSGTVG